MPSATPRRKRAGSSNGARASATNGSMSAKRKGKGKGAGKRAGGASATPGRANGGTRRVTSSPAHANGSRDSTKRSRPRGSASVFGGAPRHLAVHRCRFVDFVPSAIQCVAFDASGTLLAVARESGDVEVWSPECAWAPFMVRPPPPLCVHHAPATGLLAPRCCNSILTPLHLPAWPCRSPVCAAGVRAQGQRRAVPSVGQARVRTPRSAFVRWRPERRGVRGRF